MSSMLRARRWMVCLAALGLVGCVDQSEPDWWQFEDVVEGSTLTGVKEGQRCTPAQLAPPPDSLRLHFIDVGQGDAIWIQTPTGENVLVDAGDGGFFGRSQGGRVVESYLTENGLAPGATLDAAIVTHAHSDHYGGFEHLFTRYVFQQYIDPGLDRTGVSYNEVVTAARTRTSADNFLRPALAPTGGLISSFGQSIDLFGPEVGAWVLNTSESLREGSSDNAQVNNTSIVIRLVYAGRGIMLTGDIHEEIEDEITSRFLFNDTEPKLTTHLLKVAHHGSDSSSQNLQQLFRDVPREERYAVIQAGRLNFGHEDTQLPREDTIFRLWSYMAQDHLFSTEADDANKTENESPGDDHVLAVIQNDGAMYVCYTSQPPPADPTGM